MARLDKALKRYKKEVTSATSMERLLIGYGDVADTKFAQKVSSAVSSLGGRSDDYLADGAARWQDHLLDDHVWPPPGLPSQTDFFRDSILLRVPEATYGHRIGVIVSDALRYECAVELAKRLRASRTKWIAGKTKVEVSPHVGMVPSYTQLGMAALLPAGVTEIDPATAKVTKDGEPTQGTEARQALIGRTVAGSVAYQADDLPQDLAMAASKALLIWVYHNAIDRVGDKLASERKTFHAVEEALAEMEALVARLLGIGCGTVHVTSDHGFIYQDRDLAQGDFADVHGLSLLDGAEDIDAERGRHFVVSSILPKDSFVIEYDAHELSLAGSYHMGVPAFTVGRPIVTGPVLALEVYQEESADESVSLVTVKVGVYDAGGNPLSSTKCILVLGSTSASSDDRKRRIRLQLTDDVDDVETCFVRVTRRVGATNSFKLAWERKYRVQRFARDF